MVIRRPAIVSSMLCLVFWMDHSVMAAPIRGRLANPGFENQPIRSAFFFTGSARDGSPFYEFNPSPNTGLYTIYPSDIRHLSWSGREANRGFAVDTMVAAGIHVVNMSYWGPRGTDNWAYWAPMQTSTYAHDELFDAALGKAVLIAPVIETTAATTNSPGFSFMDCFPGDPADPAPPLVAILKDLIQRYLVSPKNPDWPSKWARVYDRSGRERYMVSLLHVASNQQSMTDQAFAEGFDRVADRVFRETGVRIGFTLDALPPDTYAPGRYRPSADTTGPWLFQQESILGIQCFIPEIWLGINDDGYLLEWKHQFSSEWVGTGIPFIQDVSPGYDAHLVFPSSVIYGNTESWRTGLGRIVLGLESQGITFNAWNGYTEGYAGIPTLEYGTVVYEWATALFKDFRTEGRHPIPGKIQAEDCLQMAGVQTEPSEDDLGGLSVGWIDAGDWMDYPVDVCVADTYTVDLRVARPDGGADGQGQIRLGNQALASFSIPGTGGWQSWKTIQTKVELDTGKQMLRIMATQGGWNINWMRFKRDSLEKAHAVPGRIEAEHYADMFGIKTERCMDGDGQGLNVGWFDAGDWLDYPVDVQAAGEYAVSLKVALDSGFSTGQGQLRLGSQILATIAVPPTGGWQKWSMVQGRVRLAAGVQTLRLYVVTGPWNLNWIDLSK